MNQESHHRLGLLFWPPPVDLNSEIKIGGLSVKRVKTSKCLGIFIDDKSNYRQCEQTGLTGHRSDKVDQTTCPKQLS